MSLKLPSRTDTIKVIVKADSALKWSDSAEENDELWASYLKSNDESLLTFEEGMQPTRFVLRNVLNYDQLQKVKNEQMTMRDGKMEIRMSFITEEVRQALVDIENPELTPLSDRIIFKREGDGGASKDLMAGLDAIGAVMDLYTARQNATASFSDDLKKKS